MPGLTEALIPQKDESHGSTEKYLEELRERAIRMAVDLRRDPATRTGALRRVGDQRITELERENRELRRANEILKTASAVFAAAELDRKLK